MTQDFKPKLWKKYGSKGRFFRDSKRTSRWPSRWE